MVSDQSLVLIMAGQKEKDDGGRSRGETTEGRKIDVYRVVDSCTGRFRARPLSQTKWAESIIGGDALVMKSSIEARQGFVADQSLAAWEISLNALFRVKGTTCLVTLGSPLPCLLYHSPALFLIL